MMHRVYSNDDDGVIFDRLKISGKPIDETLCRSYIHMYRGSGVTDLLFNICCQYSMTPSEVWESAATRSLLTEVDGEPVSFEGTPAETARLLLEKGKDMGLGEDYKIAAYRLFALCAKQDGDPRAWFGVALWLSTSGLRFTAAQLRRVWSAA